MMESRSQGVLDMLSIDRDELKARREYKETRILDHDLLCRHQRFEGLLSWIDIVRRIP